MTIDQLLLIAFLLAVPLLERLMRALRERDRRSQGDQPRGQVPEWLPPPTRRPFPGPVRVEEPEDDDEEEVFRPGPIAPPIPAPQRLPPRPATPERPLSRERARPRRDSRARPATPLPAGRPSPRVRRDATVLRGLRPSGLRRAIVLMTILGPCRALPPEDAAHRVG